MFILLSNIKNTFVFYWGRFSVNEWFGVGFLELYFIKNIEGYHIRMYHLVIGWHTLEWTSFQNQMLHSHWLRSNEWPKNEWPFFLANGQIIIFEYEANGHGHSLESEFTIKWMAMAIRCYWNFVSGEWPII